MFSVTIGVLKMRTNFQIQTTLNKEMICFWKFSCQYTIGVHGKIYGEGVYQNWLNC